MIRLLAIVLLVMGLTSCGNVNVGRYADQQPQLDLERFFSKPVKAWGIYQKRSGEVIKRFEVDISSRREGDRLILDERFLYSDGSRQRRVWTLTPTGPGRRCNWRGVRGGGGQCAALALSTEPASGRFHLRGDV
jgi:hypothetical protein